ncbi:MAG: XRE family transcriptional regulator [Hyphomicrobium sp.]|uniref:XRE family transcriptional regulator n=1 Tax=Hyphomicrobium sp. TaxID=82 RepID=UPI0035671548
MKLNEYLSSNGISDADFATAIERDRSSVSRLRRSKTKPDWETAQRIYEATAGAVTPTDFFPFRSTEADESSPSAVRQKANETPSEDVTGEAA